MKDNSTSKPRVGPAHRQIPMDLDWWPAIAEALDHPGPRDAALVDLRFWEATSGPRPSVATLASLWGWLAPSGNPAVGRVRTLIASGEWEVSDG